MSEKETPDTYKIEPKKVILALLSLALAFVLILISILSVNSKAAEESGVEVEEIVLMGESDPATANNSTMAAELEDFDTATVGAGLDYQLVYPGILPDHPLYWLKMIRDRIRLWLTSEPAQKTERLILYADKRLGAGKALVAGNKKSLGMTTITKAVKYLQRAREETKWLEGEELNAKKAKLRLSTLKHQAVLNELNSKIDDPLKKIWDDSYRLSEEILKNLE